MLKKLLHIVLIATLLMSPVVSAVSSTLMSADSGISDSSSLSLSLQPLSTATPHHIHNQAVDSDSTVNTQITLNTPNSQSCCLDCDDECNQVCFTGITQASALSLSYSLNTAISFTEMRYLFVSIAFPERPPRLI